MDLKVFPKIRIFLALVSAILLNLSMIDLALAQDAASCCGNFNMALVQTDAQSCSSCPHASCVTGTPLPTFLKATVSCNGGATSAECCCCGSNCIPITPTPTATPTHTPNVVVSTGNNVVLGN